MLGMRFNECREIKRDIEKVNKAQEQKEEKEILDIDIYTIEHMTREQLLAEDETE